MNKVNCGTEKHILLECWKVSKKKIHAERERERQTGEKREKKWFFFVCVFGFVIEGWW